MQSYTLEHIKRDSKQGNLYNIFQKTVVDNKDKTILSTIVETNEEMRLDLISYRLYGTTKFEEELMVLNNILNSWSIKAGDEIKYFLQGSEGLMWEYETTDQTAIINDLANPSKNTKKDPKRSENLNPTIKPANLKAIDVNKDNRKIKIIDTLQ